MSLAAFARLPCYQHRESVELPGIRTRNASGYIWREFAEGLDESGLSHRRIKRHCTEDKGLVGRVHDVRTASSWTTRSWRRTINAVQVVDQVIRGTTRSGCTMPWGYCSQWSTTGVTRRPCTKRLVASWPRPEIVVGSAWGCGT